MARGFIFGAVALWIPFLFSSERPRLADPLSLSQSPARHRPDPKEAVHGVAVRGGGALEASFVQVNDFAQRLSHAFATLRDQGGRNGTRPVNDGDLATLVEGVEGAAPNGVNAGLLKVGLKNALGDTAHTLKNLDNGNWQTAMAAMLAEPTQYGIEAADANAVKDYLQGQFEAKQADFNPTADPRPQDAHGTTQGRHNLPEGYKIPESIRTELENSAEGNQVPLLTRDPEAYGKLKEAEKLHDKVLKKSHDWNPGVTETTDPRMLLDGPGWESKTEDERRIPDSDAYKNIMDRLFAQEKWMLSNKAEKKDTASLPTPELQRKFPTGVPEGFSIEKFRKAGQKAYVANHDYHLALKEYVKSQWDLHKLHHYQLKQVYDTHKKQADEAQEHVENYADLEALEQARNPKQQDSGGLSSFGQGGSQDDSTLTTSIQRERKRQASRPPETTSRAATMDDLPTKKASAKWSKYDSYTSGRERRELLKGIDMCTERGYSSKPKDARNCRALNPNTGGLANYQAVCADTCEGLTRGDLPEENLSNHRNADLNRRNARRK